ncbi:MAG: PH domain-containing protein [Bacteroidaceae bacterium]|nr:PH domain-containing protein [Bacteroidaceae bacterium]MCF0187655.1 PH domain-containing protein [Bacteroidaceae bacterium]
MNKVFHEKITLGKFCFLLSEIAILSFFAWNKMAWPSLIFLIMVVYTLEMLFHSTYTVTSDGQLVIYKGRFAKKQFLRLSEINRVESGHYTFNFGRHWGSYVLVVLKNGKEIGIRPEREEEFITYIEDKQTQLAQRKHEKN